MFGISFDKGTSLKVRIHGYHNALLNNHGYYKIDDLQDWGNCGLCGKPINGIFPKDWAIGNCEDCIKKYDTLNH